MNLNSNTLKDIIVLCFEKLNDLIKQITTSDKKNKTEKVYDFVAVLSVIYSGFINNPILTYEIVLSNNSLTHMIEATNIFKSLKIISNYMTKVKNNLI